MKLTVSSTAMMNPLLQTDRQAHGLAPPKRVVGLLDMNQTQPNGKNLPNKLVQYNRPDTQQAMLQAARPQDFLNLNSAKNELCTAVFGFHFDGTNAWYQLWNCKTDRASWLQHSTDMNYEPFALLTMNALVTLLPNWDGTLHRSPEASSTMVSGHNQLIQACEWHEFIVHTHTKWLDIPNDLVITNPTTISRRALNCPQSKVFAVFVFVDNLQTN